MKKINNSIQLTLGLMFFMLLSIPANSQNLSVPMLSPYASITQRVGISDVTITYHSPAVKGRTIWGGVVRSNSIWRAGANNNTTITLTHDAKIEGEEIKAGTYGLYMYMKPEEVYLILSKYSKSWGTVTPKEDELVLNVPLKMEESPFQEWLTYEVIDNEPNNTTIALKWEKKQIPFNIEFDVPTIAIENAKAELKGVAGFSWRGYSQAAYMCLQFDTELELAEAWIDQSISMTKNFVNLNAKAQLLTKKGDKEGAKKVMEEAIPLGSPFQLNNYGYTLLNSGDTKGAIEVFETNVKKNKDHQFIWGFTDSLGEAYLMDGNKKKALEYYQKAKSLAPENQQSYLDGVIAKIMEK
ncbi:DUF2911 domain-containing protein [Fulvivirga lutimaris]|uniref:DUF2911 domain-containing protein n=1 Tax=Fulvivirga lutimaris TaxID=1819566 RepID=UPI001624F74A|nr:DUF2911 domain-containing protein [Fulvivirga lutimaris]